MTRTRAALLTVGDPERLTGGYLFHRRMADAAARYDTHLGFVSIPDLPLAWALCTGPSWLRASELRHADVVVLDSIGAAPAAPWLGSLRAPIVGMLHQAPGGMESPGLARRVRAPFDRWAYRRADLLMVASEWLVEELARDGVARQQMRLVRPGKDPGAGMGPATPDRSPSTFGGASRSEASASAFRRGRRIAAVCVANWLPRKGIIELLEAVAALPDDVVTLHLVGDTTMGGRYAERVRHRLGAADLRGRVIVHGAVSSAEVAQMYRSVDAFVLPSFVEPYGTVWGEAMAAGLPVIGWRAGNLPFLADHDREALIMSPGDVPGLSAAIRRIADDPALRERIGRAAAVRADERPTWEETAATFFGIIQEVRARRPVR